MSRFTWTLCLLLLPLAGGANASQDRAANVVGTRVVDVDGALHRLGMAQGLQPHVLVFLDTSCPISNRYAPRLNELAHRAAEQGVEFYGVVSNPSVSALEARKHREEYALDFPVLFDASGDLARHLGPTHVPEAFVIGADDRIAYRGRIDNRFVAIGTLRKNITSHDLLDAIARVATGDTDTTRTEPVGCVFESWERESAQRPVTYNRDIAPLLAANCVECHRTGDVGPFALGSYDEVQRRARMLALVTTQGTMPPWHAEENAGHFRDERRLSARQISRLADWAAAGAPEGAPEDMLPAPVFDDARWRLGKPDLLVEMLEDFEVPAAGDDIYRYFVVPSELVEDKAIVAIDFRPGDPSVVHHCLVYIDRTGVAARIDARSDGQGFSMFGDAVDENGERFEVNGLDSASQVAGWAPGTQPYVLPPGFGSPLAAGGDFVLEIHYHLTGKATTDRSALALYFADEPVEHLTHGLVIGTQQIDIPAGEPDYWRHVYMDVPNDMDIIDVSPHMHYLGKMVDVVATLPDGSEQPLIRIDDWDFRWQGAYFYREPVHIPAGSRIDAYFRFDNSDENPFNPVDPPERVREGWRTTDEMCLFYFTVVPGDQAQMNSIYDAMFQSFLRSSAPE